MDRMDFEVNQRIQDCFIIKFLLVILSCLILLVINILFFIKEDSLINRNMRIKNNFYSLYTTPFNTSFDVLSTLYLFDSPDSVITENECYKLYHFYNKNQHILKTAFTIFANNKQNKASFSFQNILILLTQRKNKEISKNDGLRNKENSMTYCNELNNFLKQYLSKENNILTLHSLVEFDSIQEYFFSLSLQIVFFGVFGCFFFGIFVQYIIRNHRKHYRPLH